MTPSQGVQLEPGHSDVVVERASSRAAFEAFYAEHRTRAIALAAALCGNRWAAEEMAHDAFVTAWQQWGKISRYDAPELWLRRTVLHRVISRSRRTASEARALGRLAARRANRVPELGDEDEAFWRHVRALPPRQAQAVALFYLEDLSIEQIALVLNVSEGAVKNALHSGRQRLRDQIASDRATAVEPEPEDGTASEAEAAITPAAETATATDAGTATAAATRAAPAATTATTTAVGHAHREPATRTEEASP